MNKAYFDTQERLDKLFLEAGEWLGTPWMANSESKLRGVACHNLPRAILIGCACLPSTFPKVIGDPNETRHTKHSRIVQFMDSRAEFESVSVNDGLRPGDVIGIRIYHCVDHLGIVLGAQHFMHVLAHKHTCFDQLAVPPWQQRIERAWRPIERI